MFKVRVQTEMFIKNKWSKLICKFGPFFKMQGGYVLSTLWFTAVYILLEFYARIWLREYLILQSYLFCLYLTMISWKEKNIWHSFSDCKVSHDHCTFWVAHFTLQHSEIKSRVLCKSFSVVGVKMNVHQVHVPVVSSIVPVAQ